MRTALIIRQVAGTGPSDAHPVEQRVVFTVQPNLDKFEHIPRGCALYVKGVLRRGPEDRLSSLDRFLDGLTIDVGDHQHLSRIYVLDCHGEHLSCEGGD